jgi:hypothetical protein
MSNDNLPVAYSIFLRLTDNVVKQRGAPWRKLADLLTSHPVVFEEKQFLPVFNGWRYKTKGDPTEDYGTRKDGKPASSFSPIGVRRIQQNLIEMSMFILDFDGKMLLSEVQAVFGQYEYVCYTSFNHQVENIEKQEPAVDKFRVVLPFSKPMPVGKFLELEPAMQYWIGGSGPQIVDPKTFSIGQVFLLPAVREESKPDAAAWRNEGNLLDWLMFEDIKKSMPAESEIQYGASGSKPTGNVLMPDDILETANGSVMVRDINRKISRVRCPFHGDSNPSEFAGVTNHGIPFLQCKKCGRAYMQITKEDPIVAGIAKLKEKRRLRAEREAQQ